MFATTRPRIGFVRFIVCLILINHVTTTSAKEAPKAASPQQLQLFDPTVFGKSTQDAVVLLQRKRSGAIVPEAVMVDINKDSYYAATVRYAKTVTLEGARGALNEVYKEWESETFAADPTMGMWRIEDETFSIQLSEDEDSIVVIYIKYTLLTDELVQRGDSRALRKIEKDASDE